MRQNVAKQTRIVQQRQSSLQKHYIYIVVTLARCFLMFFVIRDRRRRDLLQCLDPNVWGISHDGVKPSGFHHLWKSAFEVNWINLALFIWRKERHVANVPT